MSEPTFTKWLEKDFLLGSVQEVMRLNSKAKRCMNKRSEDPFDYMDLIGKTLIYIGNIMRVKKFEDEDKLLKRKKDNVMSQNLREQGNKAFLSGNGLLNFEESLGLYTMSIAYAILNSEEMAKGFANRSAVLLRLERPQESLGDIERALNLNYPKELIPKLIIRKAECFSMLASHSYVEAKIWLKQMTENDPNRKILKKQLTDYTVKDYKYIVDKEDPAIPVIESPHAEFSCASDAIDVDYSGPDGRKIVATRDIRVGEVLVVEKSYLSYTFEETIYYHCAHCVKSFWTGIPCDSCPNVVYCSEKCKLAAWKEYHSVECAALNLLMQNENDPIEGAYVALQLMEMIACLKLVIKSSSEAGGLDELQERIKKFQRCHDGKLKGEWYEKSTLESILTLNSNIKKLPDLDFQITAAVAMYILLHLATSTNFLGIHYKRNCRSDRDIVLSMAQNKKALFVGGLLVELSLIQRYNNVVVCALG